MESLKGTFFFPPLYSYHGTVTFRVGHRSCLARKKKQQQQQ